MASDAIVAAFASADTEMWRMRHQHANFALDAHMVAPTSNGNNVSTWVGSGHSALTYSAIVASESV